ncbi:MAG: hypothetical protein IPJ37_06765 [Bacteroidales bacterium]|nr:hypothetical protein [Bacteroidales bacterium]
MNYFRYCLLSSKDSSYIDALTLPPDSEDIKTITYKQEEGARNLWCSHIFPFIAKRNYILENNDCFTRRNDEILKDGQIIKPFTFREEYVFTDMHGMVWPDTTAGKDSKINVFEIADKEAFASQMTSVVSHLLRELDR